MIGPLRRAASRLRYALPGLIEALVDGPDAGAAGRLCVALERDGLLASAGYFQRACDGHDVVMAANLALIERLTAVPGATLALKAPALGFDRGRIGAIADMARTAGLPIVLDAHGPASAAPCPRAGSGPWAMRRGCAMGPRGCGWFKGNGQIRRATPGRRWNAILRSSPRWPGGRRRWRWPLTIPPWRGARWPCWSTRGHRASWNSCAGCPGGEPWPWPARWACLCGSTCRSGRAGGPMPRTRHWRGPICRCGGHGTDWECRIKCQGACKPGFVARTVSLKRDRIRTGSHSSRRHVAMPLQRPTRAIKRETRLLQGLATLGRAAPIRSCSGWGLPCRRRYRKRGALLPHPFTLTWGGWAETQHPRRSALCGTFPGVTPGGRYPPPLFRGARTFLGILR
jgi:hypothetical protein